MSHGLGNATHVLSRLLVIAVLWVSSTASASAAATFRPLGFFGAGASKATDVSADGLVVVGVTYEVRNPGGIILNVFRWTDDESMVKPMSLETAAVSADGSVVVAQHISQNGPEAFRWTAGGIVEGLGDLPGGAFISRAFDVSANGDVVVGDSSGQPFRWTSQTGMVGLGYLQAGEATTALGVSADGSVVVGHDIRTGGGRHAFRWTAETGMVDMGFLSGGTSTNSEAHNVSADGLVVVGTSGGEAFRWSQGQGMVGLGDLPGGLFQSAALGVSHDGSVIVGVSQTQGEGGASVPAAFYWTQSTGMLNLRDLLIAGGATGLEGWMLTEARGVSWDGLTIVGTGDGGGWVATIPESSTIVLAILAAVMLLVVLAKCQVRGRNGSRSSATIAANR
jgi:probable HAF family extracellular repeat protein